MFFPFIPPSRRRILKRRRWKKGNQARGKTYKDFSGNGRPKKNSYPESRNGKKTTLLNEWLFSLGREAILGSPPLKGKHIEGKPKGPPPETSKKSGLWKEGTDGYCAVQKGDREGRAAKGEGARAKKDIYRNMAQ